MSRNDRLSARRKPLNRRSFLKTGVVGGLVASAWPAAIGGRTPDPTPTKGRGDPFPWVEATIDQLSAAMASGATTALAVVGQYLARIEALDRRGPALNSVIEINPDCRAIAAALDRERKERGPRGPLHGIPVLIKDNFDTADRMATTAGSLALLGSRPPADSFVVRQLRRAGAVILGKTNLSEWANIRSTRSTSGWSGRGGLTRNPYALDRNTSGSSSGSGAAAPPKEVPFRRSCRSSSMSRCPEESRFRLMRCSGLRLSEMMFPP